MNIQESHRAFNKNPSLETFRNFQILHDPNHRKCIECQDVIYYPSVSIRIKNGIVYRGSCYQSTKKNEDVIHHLQVCQSCLYSKFPSIVGNKRIFNTDHKAALWAFGIDKVENPSKRAVTLRNLIKKYGEIEGQIRFDEYKRKQSYTNSFEYKKEKYGWTKEQFNEFNRSRAITVKNMIKKYGEEEGIHRFNLYCERQAYTNTLEYFLEKYGDEGKVKFNNYIRKRHQCYSDISQELFNLIKEKINIECVYALNGKERYFSIDGIRGFFDFLIPEYNIIIEYDGDAVHANPEKYKDEEFCHPHNKNITAKEIRKTDKLRDSILKNNGYSIIRIWHSDYINNQKETTEKILHKIKELIQQKNESSI